MITLFQFCDHCKIERNFDPETMKCKVCNHKNQLYGNQGNKQNSRGKKV